METRKCDIFEIRGGNLEALTDSKSPNAEFCSQYYFLASGDGHVLIDIDFVALSDDEDFRPRKMQLHCVAGHPGDRLCRSGVRNSFWPPASIDMHRRIPTAFPVSGSPLREGSE
ncbi:MAG: hypothetical protein WCC35_15570, partial [Bradyrhizobium sp.]